MNLDILSRRTGCISGTKHIHRRTECISVTKHNVFICNIIYYLFYMIIHILCIVYSMCNILYVSCMNVHLMCIIFYMYHVCIYMCYDLFTIQYNVHIAYKNTGRIARLNQFSNTTNCILQGVPKKVVPRLLYMFSLITYFEYNWISYLSLGAEIFRLEVG